MPYATAAQFVERFSEREAVALSDRANTGLVDEAQLGAGGLVPASEEIDTYIGRRYALPLAAGGVPLATVPQILVGLCCDIARYRLTSTEVQETEPIRRRYTDAIKLLEKLAAGGVVLGAGVDLAAADGSTGAAGGGTVRTNDRNRLFGRCEGY